MPMRVAHPCAYRGCPSLVHGQGRYCEEHERLMQRNYDKQRGSPDQRGYGHRWRKLREMVLARDTVCVDPFGIHKDAGEVVLATEADHIISKNKGGDDSMGNLQGLCHECHSRKTALEDGGFGNARGA